MANGIEIFDGALVARRKARAGPTLPATDFLYRAAAVRLVDRLADILRSFPLALEIGNGTQAFAEEARGQAGIERLVRMDGVGQADIVADPAALPFGPGRFDLIVSALGLHWINDLPGTLIQIGRALKPDGLFLAAMPGGGSLRELRESLLAAEAEVTGGAAPRVAPFLDVRDGAGLLQRAGFSMPVADTETITVTYATPLALLRDLRAAGETNALIERSRRFLRRETMMRAMAIYQERFAEPDGRVRASFELVTLTGWAPHNSQPKPLRPGSAQSRLADALGTREKPL